MRSVRRQGATSCAGHVQLLGGASPLPVLIEERASDDARATAARRGLKEACNRNPHKQPSGKRKRRVKSPHFKRERNLAPGFPHVDCEQVCTEVDCVLQKKKKQSHVAAQ